MALWDPTAYPAAGLTIPDIPATFRQVQDAVEDVNNKEHTAISGTMGSSILGGLHKQGSARCFSQASAPTTRVDGTAFTSADFGSLWVDTDDNALSILTAISPTTWTLVSTEVIAVAIAAIHTWAAAQTFAVNPVFTKGVSGNNSYLQARNAGDDGNINLIKAGTNDLSTLPDSAEMASNAAPVEDEAISNKKYVDDQIATVAMGDYGARTTKAAAVPTSETDEIASTQAATDLLIIANCWNTGSNSMRSLFRGYTDAANPPTTIRGRMALWGDGQIVNNGTNFVMFVKKDDYYKITAIGFSGYVADVDRTYDVVTIGS